MKKLTGKDFVNVEYPKVVVFGTGEKFYSAVQALPGRKPGPAMKWLGAKIFTLIQKVYPEIGMYSGELVPVHTIFEHDAKILWYEDENYEMRNKATRFLPIGADDAIHKWVQSEGLKLYEVK